ncbi:ABC transporter substrate-binding protein [Desulfosporosinus sp. PR]|uniref:ABC transporter substrate-binding protein n=1 Tax=Candidatus Desulfosporosinus nitrosoreducens TaxID=3401928 RepID=UPI0027F9DA7A|nr:ABC transporter substrate-binding protein [Desulfosporosinus sp. PR]MDQ7097153.1 ABC transporter substrate-binding protein [Desulfosporosinus sp. PR]
MKKGKLASLLAVIMMILLVAAGCGSGGTSTTQGTGTSDTGKANSGKLDKVTLQLKWLPQSQFMGYYVAQAKGYYKDEGIDLEILPGGSDIIPEQQVNNGVADIGVTWVSSLMKYQSQGWGLVEVGQIFQKSAMLLVSKASSGINSPADLKGKKVGSWFGGNEYEIYALLEANGLNKDKDLKLVQQDYTMNQLLNNQIDAASAMTYNEYGLLLESGLKDSDLHVINMNDAGVAMLEDCLFVNSDWISKNEDLYVRFLKASIKGWADACADPEAAGKIVYNVDQSVSLAHQVYMAKEVAKLVAPQGFDPANIGYIDMNAIKQTADLAYKYGLLSKPAVISDNTINSKYWKEATGK